MRGGSTRRDHENHSSGGRCCHRVFRSRPAILADGSRRIASSRMLPDKFPPMTGAASPNRVGGAHGGDDQHGCATRGAGGGGGALPVGGPAREGSHTRRAVRDDRLASQACVTRSIQERLERVGRGAGGTPARAQVRRDQGCSDSAMGSIRPGVRQAARGDDPDACCRRSSGTADCSSVRSSGRWCCR